MHQPFPALHLLVTLRLGGVMSGASGFPVCMSLPPHVPGDGSAGELCEALMAWPCSSWLLQFSLETKGGEREPFVQCA